MAPCKTLGSTCATEAQAAFPEQLAAGHGPSCCTANAACTTKQVFSEIQPCLPDHVLDAVAVRHVRHVLADDGPTVQVWRKGGGWVEQVWRQGGSTEGSRHGHCQHGRRAWQPTAGNLAFDMCPVPTGAMCCPAEAPLLEMSSVCNAPEVA